MIIKQATASSGCFLLGAFLLARLCMRQKSTLEKARNAAYADGRIDRKAHTAKAAILRECSPFFDQAKIKAR